MRLLEDGDTVRDTYEVERFLGEGAFAEVYRVKHRFLGRQAMKVFKRRGMELDEIHEMLAEAILLSRIGHPNIVRVFDANVVETAAAAPEDRATEQAHASIAGRAQIHDARRRRARSGGIGAKSRVHNRRRGRAAGAVIPNPVAAVNIG
ncbi:MAG: hypothetical protein M3Z85_11625, partial [Acidobacteriota bacterium]|nr:hypothetical protein [Acidobacteriota bacterium]